ncbi:hypothetical protein ACWZHB_09910 [Nocardia sp. FBN12]|uniref:hypothetical protein n=1 Tax=Nocardia sp. FBN12 TaxID=3419766 RepID=UPI003D089BA6
MDSDNMMWIICVAAFLACTLDMLMLRTIDITAARGGHGSQPHQTVDPVAAEIILALQTLATRQFDAFDPVIISVTRVETSTEATNAIPLTVPTPMMGSQDFAFVLDRVPGTFLGLHTTPTTSTRQPPSSTTPPGRVRRRGPTGSGGSSRGARPFPPTTGHSR